MKQKLFKLLALPLLALGSVSTVQAEAPRVTIKAELAEPVVLEGVRERNYLKISLTGFPLDVKQRSPINLALVIDRSGSMGGDRIEKARDAAIMAVNLLGAEDTLSVVTYDDVAQVVIPATKVRDKKALIREIENNINPRGMTALYAGVEKGIAQVNRYLDKERVNRIILLSDGQANVGPTSVAEVTKLSMAAARKGITITTMGIGAGYNEDLMTAIASYSDGNHVFVGNVAQLEEIFSREFDAVMSVVAQDVEVIIRTGGGVKPVRLLGREGSISGNTVTVKLNQLYAEQEKYVLLEVVPAAGMADERKTVADVDISYRNLGSKRKDNFERKVIVNYSSSQESVRKAQNENIVVDAEIQRAALESDRAVQLMDQGRKDEAKAVLQQNASRLQSLPVSSATALRKAQQSADMNEALMQSMEVESDAVSRKEMREYSHKIKNQQE